MLKYLTKKEFHHANCWRETALALQYIPSVRDNFVVSFEIGEKLRNKTMVMWVINHKCATII